MAEIEDDLFGAEPKDLPAVKEESTAVVDHIIPDAGRICPQCKKEASRIVSNMLGRQAYCGPCKFDWAIGPPVVTHLPPIFGRGMSKQTVVGPDWNLANEDIDPQGPK